MNPSGKTGQTCLNYSRERGGCQHVLSLHQGHDEIRKPGRNIKMRRHFLRLAAAAAFAWCSIGMAQAEEIKVGANIGNVPW